MDKKKVLVIEDDSMMSNSLTEMLEDAGFEVQQAFDGETGTEMAQKKPDMILLDIVLPKKHGVSVLEDMKKSQGTKDIPVFILTASGTDADEKKSKQLGVNAYMIKNQYTLAQIVEKTKEFLAQ